MPNWVYNTIDNYDEELYKKSISISPDLYFLYNSSS